MDYCETMVMERKKMEAILDKEELKSPEEAVKFAEAISKVIWNHQMLGLVYKYYTKDAVLKGPDGDQIVGPQQIQEKFLTFIASFPDLRVVVSEAFAKKDSEDGYMVYQRTYCEGTNTGMSMYGPPTFRKLNEKNSLGQSVFLLRKEDGCWKIAQEYSIRSKRTIENLLKNLDDE